MSEVSFLPPFISTRTHVKVLGCLLIATNLSVAVALRATQTGARYLAGLPGSAYLDELAYRYRHFLEQFRPLWRELQSNDNLTPQECLLARILLIHEYRKILLRDPQLPDELLPGDWEGRSAKQLCRNLYRKIYARAEQWLDENLENASGPLPSPNESFFKRFGGLRDMPGDVRQDRTEPFAG